MKDESRINWKFWQIEKIKCKNIEEGIHREKTGDQWMRRTNKELLESSIIRLIKSHGVRMELERTAKAVLQSVLISG